MDDVPSSRDKQQRRRTWVRKVDESKKSFFFPSFLSMKQCVLSLDFCNAVFSEGPRCTDT